MRILYWNVYVGHEPKDAMRELGAMINEHNPHVIGLGEASRLTERVHHVVGYEAFSIPETYMGEGETIALVRDDVNLRRWNWLKMTKWWTGPKHGLKQGPKRYWNGRIKHDGVLWRISIGHWPFNTARPETEDRIEAWFKRALPWRKSAHLGDLNTPPNVMDQYVKRFRGKHTGVGIDRIMFRNCTVTARDLGRHGSDHPAVLFTLKK